MLLHVFLQSHLPVNNVVQKDSSSPTLVKVKSKVVHIDVLKRGAQFKHKIHKNGVVKLRVYNILNILYNHHDMFIVLQS